MQSSHDGFCCDQLSLSYVQYTVSLPTTAVIIDAWWVSITPCDEYFIEQSPVTHTKSVYMFDRWCCILASIDYLCYDNTCFICCYSVKFVLQDSNGVGVYFRGFAQQQRCNHNKLTI